MPRTRVDDAFYPLIIILPAPFCSWWLVISDKWSVLFSSTHDIGSGRAGIHDYPLFSHWTGVIVSSAKAECAYAPLVRRETGGHRFLPVVEVPIAPDLPPAEDLLHGLLEAPHEEHLFEKLLQPLRREARGLEQAALGVKGSLPLPLSHLVERQRLASLLKVSHAPEPSIVAWVRRTLRVQDSVFRRTFIRPSASHPSAKRANVMPPASVALNAVLECAPRGTGGLLAGGVSSAETYHAQGGDFTTGEQMYRSGYERGRAYDEDLRET
jgi:hypothetical protein